MSTVAYLIVSLVFGWALTPAVLEMLTVGGLLRPNYRHEMIPVGAGVVIPLAALPALILASILGDNAYSPLVVAFVLTGYCLLGLLDDAAGDGSSRGIIGHIRALIRGELTTGMVKAGYGLLLAFLVAWVVPTRGPLVLSMLLISLTTNTVNLFDLRPGRALKVFYFAFSVTALFTHSLGGPLVAIPASGVVLFTWDLRAKAMLGDTGANLLGATLGLLWITQLSVTAQFVALLILIGLHVYAEKRSITKLVDQIPLLSWLDDLGRDRP